MNLFRAENVARRMAKEGASKDDITPVYAEAYKWEHLQLRLQGLHCRSHGIKRGQVVALLTEKNTVDQIAKMLPIRNPVDARSAALFHLNCLVNEGALERVYEKKFTFYRVPETEEE
jgi:hypothetical protein